MVEPAQVKSRIGEKVEALARVADAADKFDVSVTFVLESGVLATYRVVQKTYSGSKMFLAEELGREQLVRSTFTIALKEILDCDKVSKLHALAIKAPNSSVPIKELRKLAIEAWSEALGIEVPAESSVGKDVETTKSRQESTRKQFIDYLRGGANGIASWKKRTAEQSKLVKQLKGCDFSNLDMTGVAFYNSYLFDFEGCNFENTNLSQANLDRCLFGGSNFRNAIMDGASLTNSTDASNADFSGASLKSADLRSICLAGAKLRGADLTNVSLFHADLRGADLSDAKLERADFNGTLYDESTVFPGGFAFADGLKYSGKGRDPLLAQRVKALAPDGKVDFDTFVSRLNKEFDQERLKKSLKMLKAESFQLFAEVKPDSLVGIVKSQTNPDLVYSCRLTETGSFACCTQNLNSCGGLRGSLCKHLLVLLIGITKSGQLDAASACEWVMASQRMNALLDKDIMSATFLRYKGAEAGEVDWRPTETIPEDYYAY